MKMLMGSKSKIKKRSPQWHIYFISTLLSFVQCTLSLKMIYVLCYAADLPNEGGGHTLQQICLVKTK